MLLRCYVVGNTDAAVSFSIFFVLIIFVSFILFSPRNHDRQRKPDARYHFNRWKQGGRARRLNVDINCLFGETRRRPMKKWIRICFRFVQGKMAAKCIKCT